MLKKGEPPVLRQRKLPSSQNFQHRGQLQARSRLPAPLFSRTAHPTEEVGEGWGGLSLSLLPASASDFLQSSGRYPSPEPVSLRLSVQDPNKPSFAQVVWGQVC